MIDRLRFYDAFGDWSGDALEFSYFEIQNPEEMRRAARMYRNLKQLHVPITALRSVELTAATRNHTGYIRFLPRPGASPFHEAAEGELDISGDPLSFDFPDEQELLIEYYATEIASAINAHGMADSRADRFLISVPNPTSRLVGYDGTVDFRGDVLRFTWGLEANPRKRMRLHRSILPIEKIQSITWMDWRHDPDRIGYVRFQPAGTQRLRHQTVDATTVILDTEERFAEGLVFAASVLERMQRANTLPPSPKNTEDPPLPPPDVTELLRKLGDLRDAGVLTEEEFRAKKKEILDRL